MTADHDRTPRRARGKGRTVHLRELIDPKVGRIDRGRTGAPRRSPWAVNIRGAYNERSVFAAVISGGWRHAIRIS